MCFLSLRDGRISRENNFSKVLIPNIIVTKFYQKLTNILEVMTFNVGKNQENYSFFQVFQN